MNHSPEAAFGKGRGIIAGITDRMAFGLFLCLMVLSLWMYAGALPWASALLILLTLLCGILLGISVLASSRNNALSGRLVCALLCFAAYVASQTTPLPPGLLAVIDDLQDFHFLQANQHDVLRLNSLSVSPAATGLALQTGVAFFVLLIAATTFMKDRKRARVALITLLASTTIMALAGLIYAGDPQTRILGLHKPKYGGHIFGSFTNRNHFACYMNLSLGLFLGYLMSVVQNPRLIADFTRSVNPDGKKRGIFIIITSGLFVIASASLATLSRGGALSALLTILIFSATYMQCKRSHSKKTLILTISAATIASLAWVGWTGFATRMSTLQTVASDPYADERWQASLATLQIIQDTPLAGTGAGTFRHIFPAYQTGDVLSGRYLHAHNDWLQWLSEFGILGILVMLPLITGFMRALVKIRRAGSTSVKILTCGCLAAIAGTALHACFDYSLHRYANLTMLAFILGTVFAVSPSKPGMHSTPARNGLSASAFLLVVLLIWTPALRNVQNEFAFLRIEARNDVDASPERWNDIEGARAAISDLDIVVRQAGADAVQLTDASHKFQEWAYRSDHPLIRLICSDASLRAARAAVDTAPTDRFAWGRHASAQRNLGLVEASQKSEAIADQLRAHPVLLRRLP